MAVVSGTDPPAEPPAVLGSAARTIALLLAPTVADVHATAVSRYAGHTTALPADPRPAIFVTYAKPFCDSRAVPYFFALASVASGLTLFRRGVCLRCSGLFAFPGFDRRRTGAPAQTIFSPAELRFRSSLTRSRSGPRITLTRSGTSRPDLALHIVHQGWPLRSVEVRIVRSGPNAWPDARPQVRSLESPNHAVEAEAEALLRSREGPKHGIGDCIHRDVSHIDRISANAPFCSVTGHTGPDQRDSVSPSS
jgi:hypothetical protein